jgi:hypothetical protein
MADRRLDFGGHRNGIPRGDLAEHFCMQKDIINMFFVLSICLKPPQDDGAVIIRQFYPYKVM